MISSNAVTFASVNAVRLIATIVVCQSSLQLIQASNHQSETETTTRPVKSLDRLDQLQIQNFEKRPHHADSKKQDNFNATFLIKKGPSPISKQNDLYANILGRAHTRYFSSQQKYFVLKQIGSEDGTIAMDAWKGYCPHLMPWLIKPFNISTPSIGSRDEIIKLVLRKRKERTNSNVCSKNMCCIFSSGVSMKLLLAWFVEDYKSFKSDYLCCKISVLCIDYHIITNVIGHDLDVYIREFDKIESEMDLGHIRVNVYNVHKKNGNDFNNSNDLNVRNRRELFSFNSSRDFNATKSFHQISIQNNIDASWGMVCIFAVVMFVIVFGCCFKMFDIKQNTKVHFRYHEGIHLMYVNDLVRRKARLLPIFQSVLQQEDEEILFQRGKKGHVPLASLVEEEEVENYNEDEQYLDL